MRRDLFVVSLFCVLAVFAQSVSAQQVNAEKPGYDDTPYIPGLKYRVHDKERPQPPIVDTGTDNAPSACPSDAVMLFDGSDLSGWSGKDGDAKWKVENGYMEVVPGTGDIQTRAFLGDCQIHLEWMAPEVVKGDAQARGNSGVFLNGRYEIQILDTYQNITYADGLAAGIYGQFPPLVNACRKPGEWQSYDIIWHGPRFENDTLTRPATVTMFHNGVLVHDKRALTGPTTHRAVIPYKPHPDAGPLRLQDHGHLVRFRNIWYRPLLQDIVTE